MLIRTQVLFPQELLNELRFEALQKKTSVSKLVRAIVGKTVQSAAKKKISGIEAMQRMLKHAYRGKAPKDLSTNDDYLYRLP